MYYKNAPYGKAAFPADFDYTANQPSRTTPLLFEEYSAVNPAPFTTDNNTGNTITGYLSNPWVIGVIVAVIILLLLWWWTSSKKSERFSY
jgi:hypothetical protein